MPHCYDLSLIKTRIIVYYGEKDIFTSTKDINALRNSLTNASVSVVFKKKWDHESFHEGKDMKNFYQNLIQPEE